MQAKQSNLPIYLGKEKELLPMTKWTLEDDVDDWVKTQLTKLGLVKNVSFNVQGAMSDRLQDALRGGSKTKFKTGIGKPDLHVEIYSGLSNDAHIVPVLIENKLGLKKLVAKQGAEIKMDERSVQTFAVNGAIAYAQSVIASGAYKEVIAIGIAGDDENNVELQVYYVHSQGLQPKQLTSVQSLNFLENAQTFRELLYKAQLTEYELHNILISSRAALKKESKSLNKLMNNHSINVEQRVIYVSGCLLAAQDVLDKEGNLLKSGLTPENLQGAKNDTERDGQKIVNHIQQFFIEKGANPRQMDLLMSTFRNAISTDADRDEAIEIDKEVGKLLDAKSSLNKQIFTFIHEKIFKAIDATNGHLDIMGETYSEFLKYAFGDGKDIGIVLTPPYVTKMMVEILGIDEDSKVMDLATGSAGFLISAMAHMTKKVEEKYGKGTTKSQEKIEEIQKHQLLGVELDAKMFTLATTNMFLRGDASATIEKGSSFERPESLYSSFQADRLLLNPPFSFAGNGMPFIEFGLNHMQKNGLAAIIVQDSAGSGKAAAINKQILKSHTLKASIKMPGDLFQPNAGVQTSIYVLQAGVPHDFDQTVKFIDFRNDGYKRTGRGLIEVDRPTERYESIIKVYKAGNKAVLLEKNEDLWDLDSIFVEAQIAESGTDWNFEQHQVVDTIPTEVDFSLTVSEYMSWEISRILKQDLSSSLLGE